MTHPFHAHTGLTIESAADGVARLRMKWKPEHTQDQGILMDYLCPTACEVPPVVLEHVESPSPLTLDGAKGCADGSVVPAPAAIANAVSDALSPLGIAINELPVTPGRSLAASPRRGGASRQGAVAPGSVIGTSLSLRLTAVARAA